MMAQSLHLHTVACAELGVASQTSSVLAFERYVLDFERPWHGTTRLVKDMLWGHLGAFRKHVKKQSNFLLWIEDEAGQDVLLGYLCMVTRMYGGRHYGMPVWPRLVEGAISHLSRPDDPCWHDRHDVALEAIRTHFTESWEQLEQALCEAPHDLDPALLQSLIDAGLFYVGERSLIRMCP